MTGVVRLYDTLKPFAELYHRWRKSPYNEDYPTFWMWAERFAPQDFDEAWQDAEDCFYPGGELPPVERSDGEQH